MSRFSAIEMEGWEQSEEFFREMKIIESGPLTSTTFKIIGFIAIKMLGLFLKHKAIIFKLHAKRCVEVFWKWIIK